MIEKLLVPDIGDFEEVEVIEILVKQGDQINLNDPVVTIESDKSSVEIPSTESGKIKDLKVKIGDKVSEGSILATIENGVNTPAPEKKLEDKSQNKVIIEEKTINTDNELIDFLQSIKSTKNP